jgi:hypothetical protein
MKELEGGLTPDLFRKYMSLASESEGGGYEGIIERMIQTFGLNYTNASKLYKAWEDPEIRAKLDDKSLQALIDKNKNEPPPASGAELDAAKTTEAITNWWTQTGQVYWDGQLPKIYEELVKAIKGYNDETGSNVPVPEIPPYVPRYEPTDVSGMSPAEALRVRRQEYSKALKSGNKDRINQTDIAMKKAEMEALAPSPFIDPIDEQTRAKGVVGRQTGRMFDEYLGSREEKEAYKNSRSNFDEALFSEDAREREAAIQFANMLESMKEIEKGAIEKHNKDDTWNRLGSANGIYEMITILKSIERDLEDVSITYEETR